MSVNNAWTVFRPLAAGAAIGTLMMLGAIWIASQADAHLPPITQPSGGCGELVHFATYKDTAFYQLTCWGKVTPVITPQPLDTVPRDPFADLDSLKAKRAKRHGEPR